MELKELTEKTLAIFDANTPDELREKIYKAVLENDEQLYKKFIEMVDGDLSVDHLQMIYQYYQADRKRLGQDYTPKCLAQFASMLVGDVDRMLDLCSGSGALTIQNWQIESDTQHLCTCIERDENVIPYLLFNLVIRNIDSIVQHGDVLSDKKFHEYRVLKGEHFGRVEVLA